MIWWFGTDEVYFCYCRDEANETTHTSPHGRNPGGLLHWCIMLVNVRGDLRNLELSAREMTDGVRNKATARALNRMGEGVRTEVPRIVRDQGYSLKVARIKKDLLLMRASPGQLTVTVRAQGRAIPLIEYQARQVKQGVTVNVKGQRKLVRHSFIATMPTGHRGVFFRSGTKRVMKQKNGKRYSSQLPITEEYGPSVPGIVVNEAIERRVRVAIAERFPRLLEHEIAYVLR
jgi:hypothetical protein